MMKKKHQPTAQDLYRARKQREEQEKDARLPPGFINHGNTCFMNSTLQGLLATELLHTLVKFQAPPPAVQNTFGSSIVAKRSPQLTNGHGLGGEDDQPWVEDMPLGDVFIDVMRKAWDIQESRTRQTMSPKEVLFTIGKKYDQYMDFRQQDAHEFLRHMLDAMRMEELDVIKKRQPPPLKDSRRRPRRKRTLPPASLTDAGEEKLQSFVDMLFGGHLASILVCEKCKKVSLTYEEFNDLSLSIKPEDYSKDRKRDRFKQFARKLRGPFRQPGPRSSSVPPTDRLRRSIETPTHEEEEPPTNEGPRRRSFEHTTGEDAGREEVAHEEALDEVKDMVPIGGSPPSAAVDDTEAGAEASDEKDEQESDLKGEEGKKDKADPWGRLGRRLSVSVRMGMKALDPGSPSRSVERGRKVRHKDKEKDKDKDREADRTPARVPETEVVRTSVASLGSAYDSGSDAGDQSDTARMRLGSASPTPSPLSNPPITAASSNPRAHNIRRLTGLKAKRKKSMRPPKPSREEQAYLRQLLADVHVASNNPFAALQQAIANGQTHTAAAHAVLTKMGHLPGIEECLRMFTAVEILDGENMVGCHRCWKIAHGLYKPKRPSVTKDDDDDEAASDGEDENEDSGNSGSSDKRDDFDSVIAQKDTASASVETFPSSPDLSGDGRVSPASTSALHSTQSVTSFSDGLSDNTSVVSAPTTVSTGLSRATSDGDRLERLHATGLVGRTKPITYGGLPIPSISTTAPESSPSRSAPSTEDVASEGGGTPRRPPAKLPGASPSDDDLLTPRGRRRSKTPDAFDAESDTSASSYESDTDVSASTSAYSDATSAPSISVSPAQSPRASTDDLPTARPPGTGPPEHAQAGPTSPKISKSKQVILRRMYKRYLIADAPPILVVHLKRFQQTSKTYSVSFSGASGVKKVDEYVSFPEFLDIGPYLAPRREDYGLDEDGKVKVRHTDKEQRRCMYRLYAVVVHIGNMLGGHYIAYTALPPSHFATSPPSTPPAEPPTPGAASASGTEHGHGAKHQQSPPRQWAYISDTVVRLTTIEEVLKAKAYICMYERI